VSAACLATIEVEVWLGAVRYWLALIERVIDQAERRALKGETMLANEKLVSRIRLLRPTTVEVQVLASPLLAALGKGLLRLLR
jgi:hypothetical protein